MDNTIDLLQIKIEKAKRELSEDTQNAIAAIDWKVAILKMRESKGYSFEQLGDLEIETELLLCGLLSASDYPKELENRMRISKTQVNELVNEMNELVFKKIREELIKNIERKKVFFENKKAPIVNPQAPVNAPLVQTPKNDRDVLNSHGIEIIPEKLELETAHPILAQKLSGSFQIPAVKTEHTLNNISKVPTSEGVGTKTPVPQAPRAPAFYPPKADPYRLIPEE